MGLRGTPHLPAWTRHARMVSTGSLEARAGTPPTSLREHMRAAIQQQSWVPRSRDEDEDEGPAVELRRATRRPFFFFVSGIFPFFFNDPRPRPPSPSPSPHGSAAGSRAEAAPPSRRRRSFQPIKAPFSANFFWGVGGWGGVAELGLASPQRSVWPSRAPRGPRRRCGCHKPRAPRPVLCVPPCARGAGS